MYALLLILNLVISHASADNCTEWFKSSKIKPASTKCVTECSSLKVNMGTFECPTRCETLCRPLKTSSESQMDSIIDVAGLTAAEIALVTMHPKQAKIVYEQMILAQTMTQKRFGRDWFDDESDAYRHFLWSGLLIKELGIVDATKFLQAHESAQSKRTRVVEWMKKTILSLQNMLKN